MKVLPSHHNDDRVPIEHPRRNGKIRLVDTEAGMDITRRHDRRRWVRFRDYEPVNGFFKGLLIILPCSMLLRVRVIWAIRSMVYKRCEKTEPLHRGGGRFIG